MDHHGPLDESLKGSGQQADGSRQRADPRAKRAELEPPDSRLLTLDSSMTAILGISAFYHDSAAALVIDGRIVAAAQEERFSRVKHDPSFPQHAIDYCLREAELEPSDLDYVGFYDKPLLKFDRLLETYLAYAPTGIRSFLEAMPLWLRTKLRLPKEISRGLKHGYFKRYVFTAHHESHAASAFFPSPFLEAAILNMDGVGEWATASHGLGRGNRISLTGELHFPHSPGLLYSAFTYFTGFRVNSAEHKLMGLAPYGQAKYADLILEKLIDLKEDGSFRMDMSYFNYPQGLTMTSRKFERLFGGPPRRPEAPLTQRETDLAASVQRVIEEIMLRAARHAHAQTGMKNLCLAGGVALNCVAGGRILREGPFERVWIQPAAGDAGGALGVALFIWHQLLGKPRIAEPSDSQCGSLLGPRFEDDQIREFLDGCGARYRRMDDEDQLCETVSRLIAQGKVVGWVHGRMEFGPRALGGRSILADPRSPQMQSVLNQKIKFRESFRPFAPSVLEERVGDYFQLPPNQPSPYMLLVAPVQESQRVPLAAEDAGRQGLEKLKPVRSVVPAVTHVDYSARVQTVDTARHGRYYGLIKHFEQKTGCPMLVNTSFNVRGEPIVCTPQEAYRCFMATNMDVLVLEDYLLLKKDQPDAGRRDAAQHLAQLPRDGSSPVGPATGLFEVNKNPSPRVLRWFGLALGLFFGLVGGLIEWRFADCARSSAVWALGAALVGLYYLFPTLRKPLYLGWVYAALPLNWLISQAALATIYYMVVTPVGLVLRLFGHDPLDRRFDQSASTYWVRHEPQDDTIRYFRQF